MTVRAITGNIVDLAGVSIPNATFSVVPESYVFGSTASVVTFGDQTTITADASGDVSFSLHEGKYIGRISTTQGPKTFRLTVDSEGPWTLGRLIGELDSITSSLAAQIFDAVDRAETSADLSQAWAESPNPPDPDDATSKSSKEWSVTAQALGAEQVALAAGQVALATTQAGISTAQAVIAANEADAAAGSAAEANTSATQALNAAIAADPTILFALPDPVPADGTTVKLVEDYGIRGYTVVAGAWVAGAWILPPKFDTDDQLLDSPVTNLGPVGQLIRTSQGAHVVMDPATPVVGGYPRQTVGGIKLDTKVGFLPLNNVWRIPTDFATPQDAIDALQYIRPRSGTFFTLLIESGYVLPTGTRNDGTSSWATFMCAQVDMSHVVIRSEDAVVSVVGGFSGSVVRNIECRGIVLGCLVDMNGQGAWGYTAEGSGGSGTVIADGSGVMNAGARGCFARGGARIHAANETPSRWQSGPADDGVIFTGAGDIGMYANHTSAIYARGADVSGSNKGFECNQTAVLDIRYGKALNCTDIGLQVRQAGRVHAEQADVSGSKRGINIAGEGGFVEFTSGVADNCGVGSSGAIRLIRGGELVAPFASIKNADGRAIEAEDAARVEASFADLSGATGIAARFAQGVYANLRSANVSNAGSHGVECVAGAYTNCFATNAADCGGFGFRVTTGGQINAHSAVGTKSQASNIITTTGLIFGV